MKNEIASVIRPNKSQLQQSLEESPSDGFSPGGFRVRIDIHAGAWWCNSCEGKTEGSQLIQPNCDYCQIS